MAAEGPTPKSKELLAAKEVEALLRIDVKTIYNYVPRGLIPYVRIQSNLRFVKADVLAWVAEHSSEVQGNKRRLAESGSFCSQNAFCGAEDFSGRF